ncbi:MAG TPA: hypothetical protein VNT42_07675, partial [Sphingomonas sp.]|nr:hypothetical protein [Sphingomonas sp.]
MISMRLVGRLNACIALLLCITTLLATADVQAARAPLDANAILIGRYGNDAPWYRDNIPLFEVS